MYIILITPWDWYLPELFNDAE